MMLAKADFFLISFVRVLEAEPVGSTPGWVASSCQHLGAGTLLKGTSAATNMPSSCSRGLNREPSELPEEEPLVSLWNG